MPALFWVPVDPSLIAGLVIFIVESDREGDIAEFGGGQQFPMGIMFQAFDIVGPREAAGADDHARTFHQSQGPSYRNVKRGRHVERKTPVCVGEYENVERIKLFGLSLGGPNIRAHPGIAA